MGDRWATRNYRGLGGERKVRANAEFIYDIDVRHKKGMTVAGQRMRIPGRVLIVIL